MERLAQEEEELDKKIQEGAEEAARHYAKLANSARQEYKVLQTTLETLQQTAIDQKTKIDEFKIEIKKSAEENFNDQTKIFDLENLN